MSLPFVGEWFTRSKQLNFFEILIKALWQISTGDFLYGGFLASLIFAPVALSIWSLGVQILEWNFQLLYIVEHWDLGILTLCSNHQYQIRYQFVISFTNFTCTSLWISSKSWFAIIGSGNQNYMKSGHPQNFTYQRFEITIFGKYAENQGTC